MQTQLTGPPAWINLAARLTRRLPLGRGRLADWIGRNSDQRFLATMPPQLGGYVFDCSLREIVARHVFLAGAFAEHEVAFMRAALKPGMRFIDVGAHWGLLTLLGSHLVSQAGHVLALEPDPRMLAKLRFNLQLNHISNVQVFEVAATDREGKVALTGSAPEDKDWAASRLVDHAGPGASTFVVRGRRLDDFLGDTGTDGADLIKIDVEGAEKLVLQGMESGLNEHRYKRILLELHPLELKKRSVAISEITDFLSAKGYVGYQLDSSPEGRRRAYYHPWRPVSELLMPLDASSLATESDNPHTAWVAAGVPLLG